MREHAAEAILIAVPIFINAAVVTFAIAVAVLWAGVLTGGAV